MFRVVAMSVLAMSAAFGTLATANEQNADPGMETDNREADAKQRARETLAQHLKISPDDIIVKSIEPRTWSDSSMGCGKRGSVALTVITEGYAVSLSANGRDHRVHVAGASAIVCDKDAPMRGELRRPVNVRGLDMMTDRARRDLAQRLGVDPSKIRLADMQPQRWPDSGLECPGATEAVQPGLVDGYRLSLTHASRIYTYHTDLKDVRPCPPIESQ